MTKCRVNYPEVVDLVAESDSEVILIIVQTESIISNTLSKLEDKINNYLSFAKDGQLYELYPSTIGKDVVIRLDIYEEVDSAALNFFETAAEVLAGEGVKFTWANCKY